MNTRFKYDVKNGGMIKDYGSDSENVYDIYKSLLSVTKLLNKLYEENEELRRENRELEKFRHYVFEQISLKGVMKKNDL